MKRYGLAVTVLALASLAVGGVLRVSAPAIAGGPQTYTPVNTAPYTWHSLGYAQFTITSTAVANLGGAAVTGTPTNTAGTLAAIPAVCSLSGSGCCAAVTIETAAIRWRDDGTAPTASVGTPWTYYTAGTPTQPYIYCGETLANFQMIALSGTPVLNVEFFQ
jgi:hypothetical protein